MKRSIFLVLAVAIACASCSVMCNRTPNLNNTRWSSKFEEFVADVGTETITLTLEFISAKEFRLETESVMPPHPATYMNADGSVDVLPGRTAKYSSQGTYSFRKGVVTLTYEDGRTATLRYDSDRLVSDNFYYRPLIFSRDDNR